MTSFRWVVPAAVLLTGCALKGDVRRVENQLIAWQEETARTDSARAVLLSRLLDEVERLHTRASMIIDSLADQRRAIFALQGTMRGEITEVQRQLVAIQELTGQSQARLSQLRSDIEQRTTTTAAGGAGAAGPSGSGSPTDPGVEQLFQMGITQLQRGSPQTARVALLRVVDEHSDDPRAADAAYWIGESFRAEYPDSSVAWFERVVDRYPSSERAPLALYKIGLDAERRGDAAAARVAYQRVVAGYPQSAEATLAREKLRTP